VLFSVTISVASARMRAGLSEGDFLALKNYDIANKRCSEITSTDVIAFANELIINVAPSTVGNYLSHLAAVFAIAKSAWAYPLDQTAMKDAFVVAKRFGYCEQESGA
jgi:hypothetical protein